MKILLTGATGFIGAHLVRRLARENVQVGLLVRPASNLWRLKPLPKNAFIIPGSLREFPKQALIDFAPR